ncbi:MAG: hypothetical protein K9L60_14320 [Methylovulum sp.]|nr:hypothetical protein [Methylovulum sp.]
MIRAKLQRLLDGEPLDGILNEGKDSLYHLKRFGEFGTMPRMDTLKQELSWRNPTDIANISMAENIVAKLAEKAKNAIVLLDIWANKQVYQQHIDRRVEKNHIKDEADYFKKVKNTLMSAQRFNMIGGDFPSIEMISGNWSVILNHNGSIKTAYQHEKNGESFAKIQTRFGYTVYEYDISEGLGGKLKKLFD